MNKTNSFGFSLVEVLIAMGITAVITTVIAQSFFMTSRGSVKTEIKNTLKQSGDFTLQQMEQFLRSTTSITSACTSGGTTATSVSFTNPDGGSTTLGCLYDPTYAITRIASTSGAVTGYLTPTNATLGGTSCADNAMTLRFTCRRSQGIPDGVTVAFSLSQAGLSPEKFEQSKIDYKTTVTVRN